MGKDKKERRHKGGLAEDIIDDKTVKTSRRTKQRRERQAEKDETYVEEKLSKKILEQARKQQDELVEEFGYGPRKTSLKTAQTSLGGADRLDHDDDDDSEDDEDKYSETSEAYYEHVEVDEDEEKAFEKFMSKEAPTRRTLADVIMEKIQDKKTEIESHMSERTSAPPMDERLVKVFKGVGEILKKYRSGKLPKAFKFIPSLTNWEEVMFITEPDQWSAAAVYQATRIFVSNLNAKMAQRFFNLVLYPRVRDDIAEYKRLNYHLYMSLKKALFKPAAFFKGILLPLCEVSIESFQKTLACL
ncbi:bystin-like [Actinia tenebrosa]|uniref:Bystin-like n=1 Tax=Actinia tenebrosa TaxID=6105 RepID=A0A6P8J5V5_ACTTE|nr:bystin-like [Actinia tenebrosa]